MSVTSSVTGNRFARTLGVVVLLFAMLVAPLNQAQAQTITPVHTKLTADLANGGSYGKHQITPDGSHVVYLADPTTVGTIEIFSVPINGGTAVKLNGALAAGHSVQNFAISPDGKTVVFQVGPNQITTFAVYSVPVAGGTAVKLTPDAPADSQISFQANFSPISPDSQYVLYTLLSTSTFQAYALFSVPILGGTPVQLNPKLVEGGSIGSFSVSLNSQRVIYSASQDKANVPEIYSVPIGGGTATKLNVAVGDGEFVSDFWYRNGNAGTRIHYFLNSNLYSVPIEGGASIKLNDSSANFVNATWSTDDGKVTLYASQTGSLSNGDAGYTLFARSLDASTSITLSTQSATGGINTGFSHVMKVSNDGTQVYFVVSTNDGWFIYRAPIAGGTNVKVVGPLPAPGNMTDDESKIIYSKSTFGSNASVQLFAVDVATGQTTMLDEVTSAGLFWSFAADQKGAIYYAIKGTGRPQIYYVPLTGGTPTTLNIAYGEMDPQLMPLSTNPTRFGNQVCVVYGFVYGPGTYRSLHSSCYAGDFPPLQNVFLPLVSR